MLLFAEDDLVSTSLIHAAVVQSSDIFDETRMLSIKNDKQTAERPIRHIVYILFFRGTGSEFSWYEWVYSKVSFSAVHNDI